VRCERRKGNELGFARGRAPASFVPARRPGVRRIKPGDDGRLSASSGSWRLAVQIRPRRARCASRFDGLAVSCWAASPRRRVERVVGRFSPVGWKGKCCTICFVNCFDIFRSIYVWFFDEFRIDFDSTQIEPTRYLCRDWNVKEEMLLNS
jgi:hypothetical protein